MLMDLEFITIGVTVFFLGMLFGEHFSCAARRCLSFSEVLFRAACLSALIWVLISVVFK